ncbi:MAG: hypothetical protein KUG77_17410, partial [Nannocystaceae bacterium]|nr:hypothetical protein [Nannocystaceae bacterium]
RAAVRAVFGKSVRDRTSAYESAAKRARNKAELFSRDWSTTLGEGLYLARERLRGEGIQGEVGIRRSDREDAVVQVVYQGKLLETIVLKPSVLKIPGFVAVVEADFEPTSDWTRSCRDEALASGLHSVAAATVRALESVGRTVQVSADPALIPSLRSLAGIVCRRGLGRSFYRAAGFSKQRAVRWRKAFGEVGPEHRAQDCHPLLSLPLYPQLSGARCSLLELRERYSGDNPLKVLLAGKWRSCAFEGYVICDKASRVLLCKFLGPEAVVAGEAAYTREMAEQRWRSKPCEPFTLAGKTIQSVAFSAHGMEVKAGFLVGATDGQSGPGTVSIRVMKERRMVESIDVPCAVAGLAIVVDWAGAPMTADFSALQDTATQTLEHVVDVVPAKLFDAVFAQRVGRAMEVEWMSCLRLLTFAPFTQPGWLEAFNTCHDTESASEAAERLARTLRLAAHNEGPVKLDVVRAVFDGTACDDLPAADDGLERLVDAIGPVWAELREVEMLSALSKPCSLADVVSDIERHEKALVMDASNVPDFSAVAPRVVLVATRTEHMELYRVFGPPRLTSGRAWFGRWRAREAFEQREKVKLVLSPDEVLVKVQAQGELQGEVGIPRAEPGPASARVVACRRRRKVCELVVPEAQASFVGVLQCDSFGEGREFRSVSERDTVRVAAACREAWPRLAEALRVAWPKFDEEELRISRAWGRLLLELLVQDRSVRALKTAGPRPLIDLPLFEHLDGTWWEIEAIVDLHSAGEAVYWTRGSSEVDAESLPRLVFVEQPNVTPLLRTLLGEIEDFDETLRLRRAREVGRCASAKMPTLPPDALVETDISGRGLTGLLWLDPALDEAAIALGDDEKLAGFVDVPGLFIAGGAVYGPAVLIEEDWGGASLEPRVAELLQDKARQLYEVVLDRFDPFAADRSFDWLRDQRLLRGLAERMRGEWEAGRTLGGRPARTLYKALRKVPLFELLNGRSVSLAQLEKLNEPAADPTFDSPVAPAWEAAAQSEPEPEPEPEAVASPTAEAV